MVFKVRLVVYATTIHIFEKPFKELKAAKTYIAVFKASTTDKIQSRIYIVAKNYK